MNVPRKYTEAEFDLPEGFLRRKTLITPGYRKLMMDMHLQNPNYGASNKYTANLTYIIITSCNYSSILDYGAGKQKLEMAFMNRLLNDEEKRYVQFTSYDPGIPDISGEDKKIPSDLVTCFDVLEHIEPECLDEVLRDIEALSLKSTVLGIHLGAAHKTLPDGRNAHLIQEKTCWWLNKVNPIFNIASVFHVGAEHLYVVSKK